MTSLKQLSESYPSPTFSPSFIYRIMMQIVSGNYSNIAIANNFMIGPKTVARIHSFIVQNYSGKRVYFYQATEVKKHYFDTEEDILETRSQLVKLDEVKSVEYVSAEEALRQFKERHEENQLLMQSLQELDDNPLEPSLNIKAQTASQYEQIVNFLNQCSNLRVFISY